MSRELILPPGVSNASKDMSVTTRMNSDNVTGEVRVELATGSVVNRFEHGPPSVFPARNIYNHGEVPSDFHDIIPIMRHYYENDALFGSVIDILVQLSVDNAIYNITEDDSVKSFFDAIVETSNIKKAIKGVFLEYHLLNNVFPYRTNTGKRRKARSGLEVPIYDWTILNPRSVHVSGSLVFNDTKIVIEPEESDIEGIDVSAIDSTLPSEYKKTILELKNKGSIELDADRVYHIARNKLPFQRYAPTTLKRVLRPLQVKEKFMQMDLSTADGILNQVIVFKLGSDEHPATPKMLEKFANMVQTPSKAYQLIWNHALEVDKISVDASVLDPKKYEPINRELMYGFSVPEVLLGGKDSSYGKDWIAVKSLVERLNWGRGDVVSWIEREFMLIAEENNIPSWPVVKLNPINFEEERTFKSILMSLYQHGIMSAQTVLEHVGFEFLTEVEQLKIEKDIREKDGIFMPNSPYQQSQRPAGRPEGTVEDEPREDRHPMPAPSGSTSASAGNISLASLKQHYEDLENEYAKQLNSIFYDARNNILKTIDEEEDRDEAYQRVVLLLALFRDKMKEAGDTIIATSYERSFTSYSDINSSTEYEKWVTRVKRWNDIYVDKLHDDLKGRIDDLIVSNSWSNVQEVFDKEHYRIPHFAREGVRVSSFAGAMAAHVDQGHFGGRWNTTFNNSCDECINRHGVVFTAEQLMSIFPAHNRCRCYITFPEETTFRREV